MLANVWPLPIAVHTVTASAALALGLWLFSGRKGTTSHRTLGWLWVALMLAASFSSIYIHESPLPNIQGFSPVHLLTLWTLMGLPFAIMAARQHQVGRHRRTMIGIFGGACVIAAMLAFLPNRRLGILVWTALGLMS